MGLREEQMKRLVFKRLKKDTDRADVKFWERVFYSREVTTKKARSPMWFAQISIWPETRPDHG